MNTNWNGTLDALERAIKNLADADVGRPAPNAPEMPPHVRTQLTARLVELNSALEQMHHDTGIPRVRTGPEVGYETVHRRMVSAARQGGEWGRIRPVSSTTPSGGIAALSEARDAFLRALAALSKTPPA